MNKVSSAPLGQVITTDPLIHVECRDGLLRRGNEILLVALTGGDLVQLLIKVGKLSGLCHHIAVHEERGLRESVGVIGIDTNRAYLQCGIAVLGKECNAVIDERLIEQDTRALEEVTAVTSNFNT